MSKVVLSLAFALAVTILGCEKAAEKPAAKEDANAAASKKVDRDLEAVGVATDAKSAPATGAGGHGGAVVELGTTKIGSFDVRASRDKVEFKAGGDAPIDVWINGGAGTGVSGVRFWIGTEDAKGSIKAKAEVEEGKWHTHAEIPSPLPAGSKLWVEIELTGSQKIQGSFDLKL